MASTKTLGNDNVPSPGFGIMGLSAFYGQRKSEEESKQVLRDAIKMGCTFWDTADMYGFGHNEELVGSVLAEGDNRSKVFLATKFANTFDIEKQQFKGVIRGDKAYVREAFEASLKRLGVKQVDLYYQHRVDPNTPIEETIGEMKKLQEEGKIRYIGMSECSAETLRRACKVATIDALQIEYSPWAIDIEQNGILQACRDNNVKIIAYSPLGRGIMTGRFKSRSDFEEGDFRLSHPRFSEENFHKNLELVERIEELAKKKGCTPGQLCLAWISAQGDDFIPIPGTKSTEYLQENWDSRNVKVTPEDDKAIREIIAQVTVTGGRYNEQGMKTVNI